MNFTPQLSDLTPYGLPMRIAGEVFNYFQDREKEGTRKTINNKPYVYDTETNSYIPDMSMPETANAWRKEGTKATLGNKPVVWDAASKQWLPETRSADGRSPVVAAPPPPTVDTAAPPAPALPPPLEESPNTTFPASKDSPLEGQRPDFDPKLPFEAAEKLIRDYFIPVRESERQAELQRSIVTAALRDRGLQELSRRQIETENIRAWRELQVARENARAAQSIALANTAYLSQIPNTGVMQAMNESMKAAMGQLTLQAPTPNQSRQLFG
jgi:hypothetical protein